jgi:hypothetical protein
MWNDLLVVGKYLGIGLIVVVTLHLVIKDAVVEALEKVNKIRKS